MILLASSLLLLLLLPPLLWFIIPFQRGRSPPGPPALPLIGHLHLLARGPAPNILLTNLAQKYGPVFSLRFGSVPVLVLSSSAAIKEFIRSRDTIFANRPPSTVARVLYSEHKDMGFAPHGERWRHFRKICSSEVFAPRMISSWKPSRANEVRSLVDRLAAARGERVDVREALKVLAFNHVCQVLMGKRYYAENAEDESEAREFMAVIRELFDVCSEYPVGDYIPQLRWLDIGNFEQRFRKLLNVTDRIINRIIAEHERKKAQSGNPAPEDFVDVLIKLRDEGDAELQGRSIKFLLLNLFTAGSDTSATSLEWLLAELIKHPLKMAKLQQEIAEVVGLDRLVSEEDVERLPYLQAVVKEAFRLHPPAPLMLPHYSSQPCTMLGYEFRKGTMLLMNIYAVGRDPDIWDAPLEFIPERMMNRGLDVRGLDFELLPFGAGKRICPGISLAMPLLHLTLANLVHAFDWTMPDGEKVDTVNESFGVTVLMANKLHAIPVPRLTIIK